MKHIFPTLLLLFPFLVSAEIYKCIQPDGKLGFYDKPCTAGVAEERITLKSKSIDWVSRLRSEKSSSIQIIDVLRKDGDVTIKYEFTTKSASNEFVRLANNVSNMPVVLMKYIKPKEGNLGRAEIKASNKPNSLFDKMKRANKQ
ncbi:hypothetical protein [Pseudoalteromonas sp. A757]|uniref:hypothetical protein n=1 Tax=Pseudoalteromonas sp. A757 TaxID=2250709 RepID=UPI000FFF0942|nr:hypothetical protein [Pseudoalteromonas sp. A757]RXE87694.1 hypothetical protein DRB05_05730 [Pseudoalteromonas sp. A757]